MIRLAVSESGMLISAAGQHGDTPAEVPALKVERKRRPCTLKGEEAHALLMVAGQSQTTLRHRNLSIIYLMIQAGGPGVEGHQEQIKSAP